MKTLIYISFFIIGGSIGWIAGLSASPVIGIILTSLLGVLTIFFSLNKYSKNGNNSNENIVGIINLEIIIYLAVLFIGFVFCGTLSLKVKNNLCFIGTDIYSKTNEIYDILKIEPDNSLFYYEISKLNENDSNYIIKLDSLLEVKIRDSLININYNKLLKFSIGKSLIEDKYNIDLNLNEYFKIIIKDDINSKDNIFIEKLEKENRASTQNRIVPKNEKSNNKSIFQSGAEYNDRE